MKRIAWTFFSYYALVPVTIAFAQGWDCHTPACEGHKAGYDWARSRQVNAKDCDVAGENHNSLSFAEGCRDAVSAKQNLDGIRGLLLQVGQTVPLGQQWAKDNRALPKDCEKVYAALAEEPTTPAAEDLTLAAIGFRNGCLEVAKKQAKRIIKEDENRTKDAAKQAKKEAH